MKNARSFFILILAMIITGFLWANGGFWEFDKENFVSKKVLELSVPFDVTINTEFLKSLDPTQLVDQQEPANESSGTSTEGF